MLHDKDKHTGPSFLPGQISLTYLCDPEGDINEEYIETSWYS